MSEGRDRKEEQAWEYGRLTRARLNPLGKWTFFSSDAGMSEDIRQGGPFPPDIHATNDEQQWAKTVAWLGREGWELVGVATEPQGENLELWFKRPVGA